MGGILTQGEAGLDSNSGRAAKLRILCDGSRGFNQSVQCSYGLGDVTGDAVLVQGQVLVAVQGRAAKLGEIAVILAENGRVRR